MRDRLLGTTTRVSVSWTGEQPEPAVDYTTVDNHGDDNAFPMTACISGNGRYVALRSAAFNLVPGDTIESIAPRPRAKDEAGVTQVRALRESHCCSTDSRRS